jgi:beta-lactamase superfamily II metal-dependent hydrolase
MLFTLEALEAAYGDCLLVHYGTVATPRVMLVDGGPTGIYSKRLRPRLLELQKSRTKTQPLPLQLVVVSHIDADHIEGILALTQEAIDAKENGDTPVAKVLGMWHNSFDDTVKPAVAIVAQVGAAAGVQLASLDGSITKSITRMTNDKTRLVLASVSQGRELRQNVQALHLPLNSGFTGALVLAGTTPLTKTLGDGLTLTIINPRKAELDALQTDWAKEIKTLKKAGKLKTASEMDAVAAEFVDDSVANLSSIVLLAECGGKSMLLTGDVRGDFVIASLEKQKRKKAGKPFHVDVLKVPHHGSWRDLADEFFEQITADHYVFSANGKFDNPDLETIKSLLKVRAGDTYTVYMTNRKHYSTKKILPAASFLEKNGGKVKVVFPSDTATIPSLKIHLGTALKD